MHHPDNHILNEVPFHFKKMMQTYVNESFSLLSKAYLGYLKELTTEDFKIASDDKRDYETETYVNLIGSLLNSFIGGILEECDTIKKSTAFNQIKMAFIEIMDFCDPDKKIERPINIK